MIGVTPCFQLKKPFNSSQKPLNTPMAGGIYASIAALGAGGKKETPAQLVVAQGFSWSGR